MKDVSLKDRLRNEVIRRECVIAKIREKVKSIIDGMGMWRE